MSFCTDFGSWRCVVADRVGQWCWPGPWGVRAVQPGLAKLEEAGCFSAVPLSSLERRRVQRGELSYTPSVFPCLFTFMALLTPGEMVVSKTTE